ASLAAFFPAEAQTIPQTAASYQGTPVLGGATQLEGVRVQADTDSVQVILDLQAAVQYNSGWLAPGLLYLDLLNVEISPRLLEREISINQKYLKRIGIAQERLNVTRVVFDLTLASRHTIAALEKPPRLVLELKGPDEIPESPNKAATPPHEKEP